MPRRSNRLSARSPAERRLTRIHGERDEERTAELADLHAELIEREVTIARCIAAHPLVSGTTLDVLAWCEHDGEQLQELFRDIYVPDAEDEVG